MNSAGPSWRHLRLLCLRAAALVVLGSALGLVSNALHPMGLPLLLGDVPQPGIPRWVWEKVRRVEPSAARQLRAEYAVIVVDVRDRSDYDQGHIPDSLNLPYREFTAAYPQLRSRLPQEATLLLYCYGSECGLSIRAAKRLLPLGYRHLVVMNGGIARWRAAGYEVTAPVTPAQASGGRKP